MHSYLSLGYLCVTESNKLDWYSNPALQLLTPSRYPLHHNTHIFYYSIWISVPHFPSSFKTLPIYLNICSCLLFTSSIRSIHRWRFLWLTTILSDFLQFTVSPFFSLSFTILCNDFCVFLSVSTISTVSLIIKITPIDYKFSSALRIIANKLNYQ